MGTNENLEKLRAALREVQEPTLARDLVTLGMIKKLELHGATAEVGVELPTPVYRDREGLTQRIQAAARKAGVTQVNVEYTVNTPMGTRGAATRLPSVRNVIAVAAGKGGVGKSTVATNLALALRERRQEVLRALPRIEIRRRVALALALDVAGAASGLGAGAHWAKIGVGVAFAAAEELPPNKLRPNAK